MYIRKATEFKDLLENLDNKLKEAEELERYDVATQYLIQQLEVAKKNTYKFMIFKAQFYTDLSILQDQLRKNYFRIKYNNHINPSLDLFYLGAKTKLNIIKKKFSGLT